MRVSAVSNAPRNTATRDRDRKAIARTKPPCGICEGEIDYSLPHTDPMSYVVDHVIPYSKGGSDTLDNKQAAHRRCNESKAAKVGRNVVLICGPPGAGKTTLAHTLGLTVYDVDDPHWNGSEPLFRQAISQLAQDPDAQGAVIRSAATLSARQAAANLCGATSLTVLETDLHTCVERITQRGRTRPPIKTQIAAAQDWWAKYEPGDIGLAPATATPAAPRFYVTDRTW